MPKHPINLLAAVLAVVLGGVPSLAAQHVRGTVVDARGVGVPLAGVSARFATQFVDSTGVLFGFSGAISLVLDHEPGGWRIVAGHSSAPVPRTP